MEVGEEGATTLQDKADTMSHQVVQTLEEHGQVFEKLGFKLAHGYNGLNTYVRNDDLTSKQWHAMPKQNHGVPYTLIYTSDEYCRIGKYCDGEKYIEHRIDEDNYPLLSMQEDGTFIDEEIEYARELLALRQKIELLFKMRQT